MSVAGQGRAFGAAGWLILAAAVAGADTENEPTGVLHLERPEGLIEFRAEHDQGIQRSAGQSIEREERLFQERARINLSGHVLDPRLAQFSLGGGGTFSQTRFTGFGESSVRALDSEYLGRLSLLPQSPLSGSLYAERGQTTHVNAFSGRARGERTLWNAALSSRLGILPMTAAYRQSELSSSGFGQPYDQMDRTFSWTGFVRSSDRFTALFNQDLERFQDSLTPGYRSYSGQAYLDGRPSEQQRLSLRGNYFERTGTLSHQRASAEPGWEYAGKTVRLDGRYRFDREATGGQRVSRQSVTGDLEHRLYESLTTQLGGHGQWTDEQTGREQMRQGRFRVDYTKLIWGPLRWNAHYGGNLRWTRREFNALVASVLDEPHELRDGVATFLAQLQVDTTTVVVTSEDHSRQFRLDTDYQLFSQGALVEIRRIVTGTITNGQRVLVSYRYNVPGLRETRNASQDRGLALQLGARGQLYVRQNRQDSRLTETSRGFPVPDLESFLETVYGTDLQWKFLSGYWSRRFRDSNLIPLTSTRAGARLAGGIGSGLSFSGGGSYEFTRFTTTGLASVARDYFVESTLLSVTDAQFKLQGSAGNSEAGGTPAEYRTLYAQILWSFRSLDLDLNNRFTVRWIADAYSRENFVQLRLTRKF